MKRRTWLAAAAAATVGAVVGDASAAPAPPRRRSNELRLPFDHGQGRLLITHAKVHVGDGTVLDDASVHVVGSRIMAVGPGERVSAGDGAERVDLGGKWLVPGFIAAATPLGLVEIGAEDSTVDTERKDDKSIRAGYDAAVAVHADSSLIGVNAIDGVTSAAVTPVGGLVSGQVAWIDLAAGDHTGIVAKPRIAVHAHLGQTFGGSRAATLAQLSETLDDADFFDKRRAAYDRRQSRDLVAHPRDLEALVPVLRGQIPLVVEAHRASDLLALVDLAKDRGIRIVVVGATQGHAVADALAKASITAIVQPSENLPGNLDRLGARRDNAAKLHAAGVRVGIAVLDEAHNVRNVSQEAGIAIAHGLPRAAALSAVTHNLAIAYGMDADYGTITAGKVANLAAYDDDPFELKNVPTQVWIRGRTLSMRSRQTRLRDRYMDLSRFRDHDAGARR